tara:strand:+ start:166 stop:426 length:261 start_codon:yes stop_codon:yes gene_type:complete
MREQKNEIIEKYKLRENDTGSTEVQVALLTDSINRLVEHTKIHKHDHSSRRGLISMVGQRRKLLKYLVRKDESRYLKLIDSLKLRR